MIANGGLSLVHSFDWFSFSLAIELLLHGWRFSTITFPWISSPAVFLAKEDWGVEQCDLVCLHPRVVHRAGIVWLCGILNPSQFDCVFLDRFTERSCFASMGTCSLSAFDLTKASSESVLESLFLTDWILLKYFGHT